ncbi:MAG: hypothetical protein HZA53_11915 [Planctomycetes bacterium]|nr:hypothetical protein [Planctomycetota bacterium]
MKLVSVLLLAGGLGLFYSLQELRAEGREGPALSTTYFPNGQVQTEAELDGGARDGAFRRYRPDGALEAEGRYAAGRMEGEWKWWSVDGVLDPKKSGVYHDGERVEALR